MGLTNLGLKLMCTQHKLYTIGEPSRGLGHSSQLRSKVKAQEGTQEAFFQPLGLPSLSSINFLGAQRRQHKKAPKKLAGTQKVG